MTTRPTLSPQRPFRPTVPPVQGKFQAPVPATGKNQGTPNIELVNAYGDWITLLLACLLIFNHFGRPFEKVLVGYRIPAALCATVIVVVILKGGLRGFTTRIGWPLLAFMGWMVLITPLSSWRGGSISYVGWYLALHCSMFLILAMLNTSFAGLKKPFYAVAIGCIFLIVSGANFEGGRLNLSGTFGNSDDVALLAGFATPFALFAAMQLPQFLLRILVAVPVAGALLYCIGLTATRAAVIGLLFMMAVYMWRANMIQRAAILIGCVAGLAAMLVLLPSSVLTRFGTLVDTFDESTVGVGMTDEAMASLYDRRDLLTDAIKMTVSHPIWGVGPGQYPQYRGTNYRYPNGHAKRWMPSHNTYLEISSENGIPGLLFYLVFLAMVHTTIRRCHALNKPNAHPNWKVGYQMCVCLEASFAYFVVCAIFMTCDQHPHQFLLAGLAVAVERISALAVRRHAASTHAPIPQTGAVRSFPQARLAV